MSQLRFPSLQRLQVRKSSTFSPSPEPSPHSQAYSKKSFPRITICESEDLSPLTPQTPMTPAEKGWSHSKVSTTKNQHVEIESESPSARIVKPTISEFQSDDDEVLGGAVSRLDEMLRRQALRSEKKRLKEEEERKDPIETKKASYTNMKSMNMIQKIARYKTIKGITPRASETRFEGRLSLFRDVKTFVDIKELMKGIHTPDRPVTPEKSEKFLRPSTFKRFHTDVKTFRDMYLQMENDEENSSTTSGREDLTSRSARSINEPSSSVSHRMSELGKTDMQRDSVIQKSPGREEKSVKFDIPSKKASRKVTQAYNDLQSQVVKHMGPNILNEMRKKRLKEPKLVEELEMKNKAEVENLLQLNKDLKNFKIFNEVIDYLSSKEPLPDYESQAINRDGWDNDFYKQITNDVLVKRDDGDDVLLMMERIDQEEKEESDEEPKFKRSATLVSDSFMNIPPGLLNDEQIKMIKGLQEYKKRSDKIISILKNKTKRIHADILIMNKSAKVKEKLEKVLSRGPTLTLGDVGKSLGSLVKVIPERDESESDIDYKERNPRRLGTLNSTLSFRKTREELYSPSSRAHNISPSDKGAMWSTTSSFQQIMMHNKKKYIELKDKKLQNAKYYVGNKKTWTTEIDDESPAKKMNKSAKLKESFNKSVTKLYDDINNATSTNKTLKVQLKKSMVEADTYYLNKEKNLRPKVVPETLQMPKKGPSFSRRAHLILDLTRDILKKQG